MKSDNRILSQELLVLIINMAIGVGTIGLPSDLARLAGPDGIIGYMIAVLVVVLATILLVTLAQRYPEQGIADYTPTLIGKFPGFLFNIFFAFLLIALISVVVRTFSEITKYFLLQKTPIEIIVIAILLAASLLARNGLQAIARGCQIILYIFFIPFLLIPFFIPVFDTGEFLPLLHADFSTILESAAIAIFALAGAEIILVIGSHSNKPKKMLRPVLGGMMIASAMTGTFIILSFGSLSVEQTARLSDPIFEMIKYIPLPIFLLERMDIFFYTIWITASYSTIVISLFTISHHLAETVKLKNGKPLVFPLAALIYFLALIPQNEIVVMEISKLLGFGWLALTFIIVPLFLIISVFQDRKKQKGKS